VFSFILLFIEISEKNENKGQKKDLFKNL